MRNQNELNLVYIIEGMDCGGCAAKVETFCNKMNGIKEAKVNFSTSTLSVSFLDDLEAKYKLEEGIQSLGYLITEQIIENKINQDNNEIKLKTQNNFRIRMRSPKNKSIIDKKIRLNNEAHQRNSHLHSKSMQTHQHLHTHNKMSWLPIIFLSSAFLISMVIESFSKNMGLLAFAILTIISLFPALKKATLFMKVGYVFSVETLMSISAIGAIFIGAAEEAAAVMILFKIGESLEAFTTEKAKAGINSLASLLPEFALRILKEGSSQLIRQSEIQKYDIIEIKAGERIPVDGEIRQGASFLDESLLTGESEPQYKSLGEKVIAGSICLDGNLLITATVPGHQNTVTRLMKLVETAQSSKTRIVRSIEKFSKIYTPLVLAIGLLVAIVPPLFFSESWTQWIYRGLTILLIGCPCALIISTPSAIASAITAATKMGILIKDASALEEIGKIKKIAFDKTGTITTGHLKIENVISFDQNENEVLKLGASLEIKSNHPLAKAICDEAQKRNIFIEPISNVISLAGKGIQGVLNNKKIIICSPKYAESLNCLSENQMLEIKKYQEQGKSIAVIVEDVTAKGFISLSDQLKPDTKESLFKLNQMGIQNIILTGDNNLCAKNITQDLNIELHSELLPEEKLKYIQKQTSSEPIIMVGDGINDAAALAAAHVGIAMGNGTDVAVDTAQIVIAKNNLSAVVDTIHLSRKTMANIKQNIAIAIGLKAIFLVLTILGDTQLWMAILADTGATVIVTLNALRLLRIKQTHKTKQWEPTSYAARLP
ncbi:heavy metal translocating P-type ATPase [Silvanigrella aquatica]|uniref:P-type Zn(2+) transporter n=1 Tax=Silvanigrella aquatica TaxID=1915309 RepID=A0A1L4CYU0_9BACT|nr:heavy metal translocating P-type ATPase [Silvanigrella aquatica]APJ03112.1 hypothetical protein AXG55_03990 [Silvanigrella aquatica]